MEKLIVFVFLIPWLCNAQDAVITQTDSTKITAKLSATSDQFIFLNNGKNIRYENIARIQFFDQAKIHKSTIDLLTSKGVKLQYNGSPDYIQPKISPIVLQKQPELSIVIDGLEKFRTQRAAGKTLQLLGMIGSLTVTAMSINASNNDKPQPPPALIYGAGAVFMIGFIVDANAGANLRFK